MKLIVLDCDGVLSWGEAAPFNLQLFARLAALNRRARQGEDVPAVTLNTGRPSPYVEAVMQAINGWQPALYESGAGLYYPQSYQFETTPLFDAMRKDSLQKLLLEIDQAVVKNGKAYWQPGKSVCYTLFAHPPLTVADFIGDVEAIAARYSGRFQVAQAKLALNIHPTGINKGSGLEWLAQVTGIAVTDMGGVGDTSGDVDFLRLVGHPAAPANATDEVKQVAQYVSPNVDAEGLQDILDHWSLP